MSFLGCIQHIFSKRTQKDIKKKKKKKKKKLGTGAIRTRGPSNWRPTLYRLSYAGCGYRAIVRCCTYI